MANITGIMCRYLHRWSSINGRLHEEPYILCKKNENVVVTHCFLYREALMAKTLGDKLREVLNQAVGLVNYITTRPVKTCLFEQLRSDMNSQHRRLLLHPEISWLSKGKVLNRVYEL